MIDELPDDTSPHELTYRAAVQADIEAGLADSAANRVTPVEELLHELGLAER